MRDDPLAMELEIRDEPPAAGDSRRSLQTAQARAATYYS